MLAAAAAGSGIDPAWVVAGISFATVVVGLIAWAARWMWRIAQRTTRFMDDFFGEEAGPGRPERPGVMARLEKLEVGVNGISAQVHMNSGHSMRDTVQRTEQAVEVIRVDIAAVKSDVSTLSAKVSRLHDEGKS